jgi:hypothetical protein
MTRAGLAATCASAVGAACIKKINIPVNVGSLAVTKGVKVDMDEEMKISNELYFVTADGF